MATQKNSKIFKLAVIGAAALICYYYYKKTHNYTVLADGTKKYVDKSTDPTIKEVHTYVHTNGEKVVAYVPVIKHDEQKLNLE